MGQLCPRDPGSAGAPGRGPGNSHREQPPCLFASRTSPPMGRLICCVHFCLLKREWWRVKAHLSLSKPPEATSESISEPYSHVPIPEARCLPILSQCPLQCLIFIQELLWSLEWLASWSSNPGFWLHTLAGLLSRVAAGCLALKWMAPALQDTMKLAFPKEWRIITLLAACDRHGPWMISSLYNKDMM